MDAEFYRAALPEPFTILGVRLRPFSLGHAILFTRFDVQFLQDDARPLESDFILGLILCACRYEQAVEVFEDPDFDKTVRKWRRKTKGVDLDKAISLFYDYLNVHIGFLPFFCRPDGISATIEAPFEQVVRVTLMSKMHRTETDVMNMPYGLAVWDYVTLKAIEGNITILDRPAEALRRSAADAFDKKWRERNGIAPSN